MSSFYRLGWGFHSSGNIGIGDPIRTGFMAQLSTGTIVGCMVEWFSFKTLNILFLMSHECYGGGTSPIGLWLECSCG